MVVMVEDNTDPRPTSKYMWLNFYFWYLIIDQHHLQYPNNICDQTFDICQVKQLLVNCGAEELVPVFAKKKVIVIILITVTIILSLSSLSPSLFFLFLSWDNFHSYIATSLLSSSEKNQEKVYFNFLKSCHNEIIKSVTRRHLKQGHCHPHQLLMISIILTHLHIIWPIKYVSKTSF